MKTILLLTVLIGGLACKLNKADNCYTKYLFITESKNTLHKIDSALITSGYLIKAKSYTIHSPIYNSNLQFYNRNFKSELDISTCSLFTDAFSKEFFLKQYYNILSDTGNLVLYKNLEASDKNGQEINNISVNIAIFPIPSCKKLSSDSLKFYLKLPYKCAEAIMNERKFYQDKLGLYLIEFNRKMSIKSYNDIVQILNTQLKLEQ